MAVLCQGDVRNRSAAIAVGCGRIVTSRFLSRSGYLETDTLASPTAGISRTADVGGVPLRAGTQATDIGVRLAFSVR